MRLLTSRRFLVGAGALALILLIWLVLLWWLQRDPVLCLGLTTLVLFLYVIYLLLDQRTAAKESADIEKSIWQQSEEEKLAVHPKKRQEVEELKEKLRSVIEKLKHARGRSALSTIPWYMMIGPPAAGKTTAIRNSGLEFPFETDVKLQGVGGTRNCDWWFSSSAIILDTAGRYVEQDDRQDWLGFLRALKKNRRRRPVNGVIVGVSITDVLAAEVDQLDAFAHNLRQRVDELITELGIRFPVFLLFTKCDLIGGFVEFFEELGRNQREQIWGCTLQGKEMDDADPRAIFDREFRTLSGVLNEMRLRRLSPGLSREQRARIYAFPLEFARARENLAYFAGKLFKPNPYQEGPLFRGFYFTSGTQEGVPIDKVVQEIARACGLDVSGESPFAPELQTKSYFIKEFFTDVVIPDSGLAQPTRRQKRWLGSVKAGIIAASAIGLVLFIALVSQAYYRSKTILDDASNNVASALKAKPPKDRDQLLAQIRILKNPPAFMLNMDRSATLADSLQRIYFRVLKPDLSEAILLPLERNLLNPGTPQSDLIENLQAYLLLTTNIQLLNQESYRQSLFNHISRFQGADRVGMKHIDFLVSAYAGAVEQGLVRPFAADPRIIAQARQRAGVASVAVYYEGLIKKLQQSVAEGPKWEDSQIQTSAQVRSVFTYESMRAMEGLIKEEEYKKVKDDMMWILGDQKGAGDEVTGDKTVIEDSLRLVYARNYAAAWWSFLDGASMKVPRTLYEATATLRLLGNATQSSVRRMLQYVTANTDVLSRGQNLLEKEAEELKKRAKIQEKSIASLISREFSDLNSFVFVKEGQQADLLVVMKKYEELAGELENLKSGEFPESVKFVEDVFGQKNILGTILGLIRGMTQTRELHTAQVLHRILEVPVHSAWIAALGKAGDDINQRWLNDVVKDYRRLSSSYPFNRSSSIDVPSAEIGRLFGESGPLWLIMGDLKKLFAENERWKAQKWTYDPTSLEITPAAREVLMQARAICQAIMPNKTLGITGLIRVEQVTSSEDIDVNKISVEIGGMQGWIQVDDPKSPKAVNFAWPSTDARLELIDERPNILGIIGGDRVVGQLHKQGDWGLFKLVQEGKRDIGGSLNSLRCTWTIEGGFSVRCVITVNNASQHPFATNFALAMPDELVKKP